MTASLSLFEPQPRLTDDLTGAVPTWRPADEPIHDQLVVEWPEIYERLCAPVTARVGGAVVEGVVLDGPPTVALTLVPTVAFDLPGVDAPTEEFPVIDPAVAGEVAS